MKQRFTLRPLTAILLALALTPDPGHAAEEVGSAHRVIEIVTGSGIAGNRRLSSADPVYRSEVVAADRNSRGELELIDGSRIIVGENSEITLDDFVIAETGFSQGTVNVAKGAFRFISGRSKDAIRIQTPLSSIGIRGTVLDIYVSEGGPEHVVLVSGGAIVCSGSDCENLQRACDMVRIENRGSVDPLPFLYSNQRSREETARNFPLTENQHRHSNGWQAFLGGCMQRAAVENTPADQSQIPINPAPPPPDYDCEEC